MCIRLLADLFNLLLRYIKEWPGIFINPVIYSSRMSMKMSGVWLGFILKD